MVIISKQVKKEMWISILIAVVLSFLLINFDKALSESFSILHFADFLLIFGLVFVFRRKPKLIYPTEFDNSRFPDFLFGVVAAASYVVVSIFVTAVLKGGGASLELAQSVFGTLASATPVLSGNVVLTFIFFAVLVPLIETRWFFGRMFEGLGAAFNVNVAKFSIPTFGLMLAISSVFTFFHLTVRSIGAGVAFDQAGLALTFVFGMVSLFFIVFRRTKELAPIIWLHIIVNSLAIAWQTPVGRQLLTASII